MLTTLRFQETDMMPVAVDKHIFLGTSIGRLTQGLLQALCAPVWRRNSNPNAGNMRGPI
jgi:hypothetical protein